MANSEIQPMLDAIGFQYDPEAVQEDLINENNTLQCYPNPAANEITLKFHISETQSGSLDLINVFGQKIRTLANETLFNQEINQCKVNIEGIPAGVYFVRLNLEKTSVTGKIVIE